jgi:hypothetical protein
MTTTLRAPHPTPSPTNAVASKLRRNYGTSASSSEPWRWPARPPPSAPRRVWGAER